MDTEAQKLRPREEEFKESKFESRRGSARKTLRVDMHTSVSHPFTSGRALVQNLQRTAYPHLQAAGAHLWLRLEGHGHTRPAGSPQLTFGRASLQIWATLCHHHCHVTRRLSGGDRPRHPRGLGSIPNLHHWTW